MSNFVTSVKSVAQSKNFDDDHLKAWLIGNTKDPGFEHLTEEEIVGKCRRMYEEENEQEKDN